MFSRKQPFAKQGFAKDSSGKARLSQVSDFSYMCKVFSLIYTTKLVMIKTTPL
jgi:hypothetical protein